MNDIIDPSPTADTTELAAWTAPSWATRTRADGAEVTYSRRGELVPVLPEIEDQPGGHLGAEAYMVDSIEVGEDGAVRVVRDAEPIILLEGYRLTLAAAHNLGVYLCNLVEDVEAMAGIEPKR